MRTPLIAFAVLLAPSLWRSPAQAQDNSAAVEALFKEGRQLAAAGNFAEACPKFLASYNLEHRVGTLLNLADCYERNGQVASAWARFVEARTLAARSNMTERVDFATQHAAALEPRRSMLTIQVQLRDPGLLVKRDGTPVDVAAFGVPVPVDGGEHTIEATAPGKLARTQTLVVKPESDNQTYILQPLADVPSQPISPHVEARAGGVQPRAIVGLTIAAIGVVAAGLGAYFGAAAISKNNDSAPYCNVGGVKDNCWGQGVSLRSDAVSDATLSTVLLSVGGAAVAGGVILWITTPSSKNAAAVGFDGRTLRFGAAF
jgi:hypothetical protein